MRGIQRVVAGTGGSPGSLVALRYADALAEAHQAVLVPVLAWTPPGGEPAYGLQQSGYLREEWHKMARERMDEALLAVWGRIPAPPLVQPRVEQGRPGWVLVSVAREPGDVLVIGAGHGGWLRRTARCKVSRYCAARASCPVVLVPPADLSRHARIGRTVRELARRNLTAEHILREHGPPGPGSSLLP
jgi:nucleotide-binding universal stress UspA family protein